jgi:hypothetical protein
VKGGKSYLCLISLLPLQNPKSLGTSPLGLTSLKIKNHPIVLILGGIGSCYASLALYPIALFPSYKLRDNILAPFSGNTESNLPQDEMFLVRLASRLFILQAYLATLLRVIPLFL